MKNHNYYIATREYNETSDEIALTHNLNHSSIFQTQIGSWTEVRATCQKHNALLYQPEEENKFFHVHKKFEFELLHIGMYFENKIWKTCKGANVSIFFWGVGEPTVDKNQNCGGITLKSNMADIDCEDNRKGLCIY